MDNIRNRTYFIDFYKIKKDKKHLSKYEMNLRIVHIY